MTVLAGSNVQTGTYVGVGGTGSFQGLAQPFVAAASGQVTDGHAWLSGASLTGNLRLAIYDATGATLLGSSNVVAVVVGNWTNLTFTSGPTLASGTTYVLAYFLSAKVYFNAGNAALSLGTQAPSYDNPASDPTVTVPSTYNVGGNFLASNDLSIYVANTSSGATGTAAITEGADAAAGVGTDQVAGVAAITEGHDTVAGVGTDAVSGAAAITEGADVAAGVGTDSVTGVAGITEGADSAAGVGAAGNNGTAAITESADVAAGVGTDQVAGAAAISETADTAAGVGTDSVTGTAAVNENSDTCAGVGNVPSALAQPVAAGGAGVPGWYGPEDLAAARPIGPHKRPGQVFGEQDPWSPALSARASAPLTIAKIPSGEAIVVIAPRQELTPEEWAALLALFIELG